MNDSIPVYGGLYFTENDANRYCDGMNDLANVPKCPTGALRLEGPYIVRMLNQGGIGNHPLGYIVTKED
jgi:hypothetical protein